MRSVTSSLLGLLFLVGSLFPQTDVEEVYKIPGLAAHYRFHKQAAGSDFDVWQFLDMHYNASSKHAKQPHKGVKIPLYNHLSAGFVFTLPTCQFPRDPAQRVVLIPWSQGQFAYQNLYAYQNAVFLLQPPQLG